MSQDKSYRLVQELDSDISIIAKSIMDKYFRNEILSPC